MKNKSAGFTLLEILIALFIFTIISMMMVGALHQVMTADSSTDKNAERLRHLQMALLLMSRDTEQTLDRPVLDAVGREDAAFVGTQHGYTFTHAGFANPQGVANHSSLQRTRYYYSDKAIWRATWDVLDQAPKSHPRQREILTDVSKAEFAYLDKEGGRHNVWPPEGRRTEKLPRAVRVTLTISHWGSVTQLYVISAQASNNNMQPAAAPAAKPAPQS